jgi:AraC-like DNA-binding protein
MTENDVDYTIGSDEFLLLEPFVGHHGYQMSTNTQFYWFHISDFPEGLKKEKTKKVNSSYNLMILFRQLLHYQEARAPQESLNYLARLILLELYAGTVTKTGSRVADQVAAWISANRNTLLKSTTVADFFGYNEDYLNRLFKKTFGKTLKQYMDDVRMDYIKKQLLIDGLSLTQVAMMAGFEEYKYFLKYFRYHEGMTPTEFRASFSKTHVNTF